MKRFFLVIFFMVFTLTAFSQQVDEFGFTKPKRQGKNVSVILTYEIPEEKVKEDNAFIGKMMLLGLYQTFKVSKPGDTLIVLWKDYKGDWICSISYIDYKLYSEGRISPNDFSRRVVVKILN